MVWQALGNPRNYVEPFFGAGAVLLARSPSHFEGSTVPIETINELNPYVVNFWQAVKDDPEQVAFYADNPVHEVSLHSRHLWLINQHSDLKAAMIADESYFDAKIAGWWVWGLSNWIGHGWCSLEHLTKDGQPWKRPLHLSGDGQGVNGPSKKIPCLKSENGVRQSCTGEPHTPTFQVRYLKSGGMGTENISRQTRRLSADGQGINHVTKQLPFVGNAGRGDAAPLTRSNLVIYFEQLATRLNRVRVTCGDFERVLGPSITEIGSTNAVFLDPPYEANTEVYSIDTSDSPAKRAFEWCKANWQNPKLRIVLCGYDGEFDVPGDWRCLEWKAGKGYARADNLNRERERMWLSPACLITELEKPKTEQLRLAI